MDNQNNLKRNILSKLLKILLAIVIAFSFLMNGYMFYRFVLTGDDDKSIVKSKEVNYDVKTPSVEVVDNVTDSVVGIAVYKSSRYGNFGYGQSEEHLSGNGSGVIYDQSEKYTYIITNHHVIDGADKVQVVFSNNEYVDATVVGSDEYSDVAILRCQPDFKVSVIAIGDSDLLDKGETVLAIGSPLGIEYAGTVTQGIVSGTDRTVSVDLNNDNVDDWDMNVIQTDAAINPGNSGGALVNMAGELVGITNMKFSDETVEGMGFAIPINDVISVANQIRKTGKAAHPFLGVAVVSLADYSTYELQRYGINISVNEGMYVSRVTTGGPAQKAGIQTGDVIVEFDGKKMKTNKEFIGAIYKHKVGDTVELKINRNGKEYNVKVTLVGQ